MSPLNNIPINAQANTGTVTSVAIDGRFLFSGSIQAIFSDPTAAGTLTLQGSNDPMEGLQQSSPNVYIPIHWDTVKNGSISATATVAAGALTTISMQWLNYRWLRVVWVSGAGAGTLTVNGFFQSGV